MLVLVGFLRGSSITNILSAGQLSWSVMQWHQTDIQRCKKELQFGGEVSEGGCGQVVNRGAGHSAWIRSVDWRAVVVVSMCTTIQIGHVE